MKILLQYSLEIMLWVKIWACGLALKAFCCFLLGLLSLQSGGISWSHIIVKWIPVVELYFCLVMGRCHILWLNYMVWGTNYLVIQVQGGCVALKSSALVVTIVV
jgi:hypothetical protein